MKNATVPKKIPMRRQLMTFLSSVASGSDRPTTPIIKAMAVPIGIPLATKNFWWERYRRHWRTSVRPE